MKREVQTNRPTHPLEELTFGERLDAANHERVDEGAYYDQRWLDLAEETGRALAQRLVSDGEQVLDVPAKLAARVRVLSVGHGRKSDPHDAVSVAVAARSVPSCGRSGWTTRQWCCTC